MANEGGFSVDNLSREQLVAVFRRAERIIEWMAPTIGQMCPPEGGIAELNEHWLFCEKYDLLSRKHVDKTR